MQKAHRSRNPGGDSCTFDALRERCASFLSASHGLRTMWRFSQWMRYRLRTLPSCYVQVYNQYLPQCALAHCSPVTALKRWHQHPELLRQQPQDQAELDNYDDTRHVNKAYITCLEAFDNPSEQFKF